MGFEETGILGNYLNGNYLFSFFLAWNPTSIGEGNETLLIRVWKPFPHIIVLKP